MRPLAIARRAWILIAAFLLAGSFGASSARADSASISFTDAAGNVDPVAGIGRTLTVSGNVSSPTTLWVRVRPAGGAPCAPSASSDTANGSTYGSFSGDSIGSSYYGTDVEGTFTRKQTGIWTAVGTFQFCIWLAPNENAASVPITQIITFRQANGTISATLAPSTPASGQTTTISVTGNTEAPASVWATVRGAGTPCAISYSADTGSGIMRDRSVSGTFSQTTTWTPPSQGGAYVLCLYLAQDEDDPNPIAVQPINFTVANPCKVPAIAAGTDIGAAQATLAAAGCSLGGQTLKADGKAARGSVIGTGVAAGTSLPPGAAVPVVISDGKSCHVPASKAGLRLSKAKAKLVAVGCTPGRSNA